MCVIGSADANMPRSVFVSRRFCCRLVERIGWHRLRFTGEKVIPLTMPQQINHDHAKAEVLNAEI